MRDAIAAQGKRDTLGAQDPEHLSPTDSNRLAGLNLPHQSHSLTGQKKAVWVQRGPDHYAHADTYAEIALKRSTLGLVRGAVL